MEHTIEHSPSYALLKAKVAPGETLITEAGAMITRSANVQMRTRLNAGTRAGFLRRIWAFFVALFRKILGGETMFINEFTTSEGVGEIQLAPSFSGDVVHRPLQNERIILQPGAFLASSPGVDLKMRWGGLRGLLSKEGLAFLECYGTGDLWISSYGGIQAIPVNGKLVVDNGHIVAFDAGLDFKIRSPGGGAAGFFGSGEGLVCEFNGTGDVYIQSRNMGALVGWLRRLVRS